ncbi:MAG: hypothetical protein AB1894_12240 [Chloroflexota bacterium]
MSKDIGILAPDQVLDRSCHYQMIGGISDGVNAIGQLVSSFCLEIIGKIDILIA